MRFDGLSCFAIRVSTLAGSVFAAFATRRSRHVFFGRPPKEIPGAGDAGGNGETPL
jgi:hypothetical protein